MSSAVNSAGIFLIALGIIFGVPYLIWRLLRTDYYAPLVVVQVIAGILLGPGILGRLLPGYYAYVFRAPVTLALNGIACWAVTLFVWVAGVELDLKRVWARRAESVGAAALALGAPLLTGAIAAAVMLRYPGWLGERAQPWQFVLGVGMACAVSALPVLILLMDRLAILRQPLGQRILGYASLDDVAVWAVLAVILMDWARIVRQAGFLALFALAAWAFRRLMRALPPADRWYVALLWLLLAAWGAERSGLHFMVGAFLAGAVMDADWLGTEELERFRRYLLLALMPVFFLSTGLRTNWSLGGAAVLLAGALLLGAALGGKLLGLQLAGRLFGWPRGEAAIIGWLLQTKGLVMIVFVSVLLDGALISSATFTALLLMAVASTMLTVPVVAPRLRRARELVHRSS